MRAAEIDAPFRLIKQPVGIHIGPGSFQWIQGPRLYGILFQSTATGELKFDAMAWMQFVDSTTSHIDLLGDRNASNDSADLPAI